jgi:cobalamin biosynthetic protein CobC
MKFAGKPPLDEIADHGGSLSRADRLFPAAPKPWLDLSTGINPHSYRFTDLTESAFRRLPETALLARLVNAATRAYAAPSPRNLVAAPGTQILLPLVASLVPPGRAAILSPTYAEHRRAASIAGHDAVAVSSFADLADADLAILVNPNNPDGRISTRAQLLELAAHMRQRNRLLIVDEAFMDVGPRDESLAGDADAGGFVVLKSFGKFFGLAGIRLGFAIAAPDIVAALDARMGPWAVSGPALEIGIAALDDLDWQADMRRLLVDSARRLDALLARYGLIVQGGTDLYRFLRTQRAPAVFHGLGQQGVLVRAFDEDVTALRFGLPGGAADFERLSQVLARL